MRIELTSSDWKSEVIPLYDIRKFGARSGTRTHKEIIPQHFKCCAFTNLAILALYYLLREKDCSINSGHFRSIHFLAFCGLIPIILAALLTHPNLE